MTDKAIENPNKTRLDFTTQLIDAKSKANLFKVNKKLFLNIGDEVIINNHTFIVQSQASVHQGGNYADPLEYPPNKIPKGHASKRVQIETWIYKIAPPNESKNLSKHDLSNKKVYKLK